MKIEKDGGVAMMVVTVSPDHKFVMEKLIVMVKKTSNLFYAQAGSVFRELDVLRVVFVYQSLIKRFAQGILCVLMSLISYTAFTESTQAV